MAEKHTNLGTAMDEIARLEREVGEERQRTTTMTLANNDKRQELRALRKQKATLLEALKHCEPALEKLLGTRGQTARTQARLAASAARAAIDKVTK